MDISNVDEKDARRKKITKIILRITFTILLIVTWLAIVYYGVFSAKGYVDQSLLNIELRNIDNHQLLVEQNIVFNEEIDDLNEEIGILRTEISALNEEILLFSLEVRSLKSSIDIIDTSISSSVQIQAIIGTKIQELDNRLKDLRNSLNILLEAPNE